MKLQTNQSWLLILITSILVAGCDVVIQTASSAPATVAPGLVDTLVVQTISARDTQTAAAQPSETATLTPTLASFFTSTSVLPTATTFTVVPPSSGGGGSSSAVAYSCDPDIDKRPRDNTVFAPNDPFDVKWTLLNDGTKTWPAGLDLTYFSGPQMTSTTFVQLPEVKPGGTFSVVLDANAPSSKGFYVMTWKLQGPVCFPYVAINVK